MASIATLVIFFFTLFLTFFITIDGGFSSQSPIISTKRMAKMTRLHFYFHDIIDGKNPTAIQIIKSPNKTAAGIASFGTTFMADDPLTVGPEPTSKVVGRAQGLYALASQNEVGLLMVMNFAFSEGIYNGSSLSMLGRNPVFHTIREMPIVGGSGVFRFARGYALAKTVWFNKNGDAVVQYNVTVVHY
ncbi:Plant disease resistance response protein [Corchorus olitorius]|uniref:Dirigent protein n=1 Tax=Corchorus olitorius TaxID=93759 RepID=A0A1R3I008_9ROSI|nr:Plant disease resistance response protein [Corchorus olitorius]